MARKVEKSASTAAAPQGAVAVEAILHPERELEIAGRALVIREYGFVEGMKVRVQAKPFLEDLYAVFAAGSGVPRFETVQAVLDEHADLIVDLVARAADVEADWVRSLDDADGELLLLNWWAANAGFFIRRVLRARLVAAAASPPAGTGSTTRSSPQDTGAAPTNSGGTPNGS